MTLIEGAKIHFHKQLLLYYIKNELLIYRLRIFGDEQIKKMKIVTCCKERRNYVFK